MSRTDAAIGGAVIVFIIATLFWLAMHIVVMSHLCKTVAAGQDFKRDGTECYVVRDNGVLEPVRWRE